MERTDAEFIENFLRIRDRNRSGSFGIVRGQQLTKSNGKEQQAFIDKWIAFRKSVEVNDAAAEEAIYALYRWADKEPPVEVVWFDSPDLAVLQVMVMRLGLPPDDRWSDPFEYEELLGTALLARLTEHIGAPLQKQQVCCEPFSWKMKGHLEEVDDLSRALYGAVRPGIMSGLRRQGMSDTWANRWPVSVSQPWIGAFAGADLLTSPDNAAAKADIEYGASLARYVSFLWLYPRIAIACRKPMELHVDEGLRPHNPSGPAIVFRGQPENWCCWCWHGTGVPQQIIERPDSIKVEDIEQETNAEFRRILMERFGVARFLQESKLEPFASDEFGSLYRKRFPGEEDVVMVRVINKTPEPNGEFKEYFLRVPPRVASPKEAVAWTFDLRNDEYVPTVES